MRRGGPTRFVVLASPRTGSAWVVDMLHSHSQVVAYPELFLRGDGRASYAGQDMPYFEDHLAAFPAWSRRLRAVHRVTYLQRLYGPRPGVRAVGFKLMYNQLRAERGLLPCLAIGRVKVIHLIRANALEALVSYELAKAAGVFHPSRGDQPASEAAVSLDAEGLRYRLEEQELVVARTRATVERHRLPRLEIAYEELVGRRDETFGRVLRFLRVDEDVGLLSSPLVRVVRDRHVDRIENVDAVRRALAGTRFQWMLGVGDASDDG
jgi:LPS sulfotransferase NodH